MLECEIGKSFRETLTAPDFAYGIEVVTTRGLEVPDTPESMALLARGLLADPRLGWISITDNPGGSPALPPNWLAAQLVEHRQRIVIHLTCKDLNRSGLESAAWCYASQGLQNILALTGDYPTGGFGGPATPVFDAESLGLIKLLSTMNGGLEARRQSAEMPSRSNNQAVLPRTDFYIGCAVSPFKRHERELLPQYFKLLRKIRAGARWVVPQLGYDMRKFHEVKLFLAARGMEVPIIGNVYRLTRGVARVFHGGKLAGVVLSDALLQQVEKYSAGPDKGKRFFDELAAKQLAVFKGLGFAAGYLGGITCAEMFDEIVGLAENYAPDDWREFLREIQFSQPGEFFLFEHDPATGLSEPGQINRAYVASLREPERPRKAMLHYWLSRKVHDWAFIRGKGVYGLMQRIFSRLDKRPGVMSGLAYCLEKTCKRLGYGCNDCGDCSLPECAFLCPLAGCAKGSRNGPCGGSADGRCELRHKECFWARVYERLKYFGASEQLGEGPVVICNPALKHTSSWANTYLARDHHAEAANDPRPGAPARATKEVPTGWGEHTQEKGNHGH